MREIHPYCVKCGELIKNSFNLNRKYCFKCRQKMLKEWGQNGKSK